MPNCGCENEMNNSCGFHEEEEMNVFPENPMLAQSYVPIQQMNNTFTPHCGLKMGTIFPELVSPYMPGQSMAEIEYLSNCNRMEEGR
ncbi:MAG: spore coat associated protein CotJA [Clostridia bacterium]|nr:spore coat associated protein CotJA [Clostridia bacterium]